MERVVITGLGAVTPLGNSFEESWRALKSGQTGIGLITKFDISQSRWKMGGEVKGMDPAAYMTTKELRRFDLFIHYALMAGREAWIDAGLEGPEDEPALYSSYTAEAGVILGSSRGGISTLEKAMEDSSSKSRSGRRVSPYLMPSTTIGMASAGIAQKIGIRGYCLGISNACASGANAIGEAYRLIKMGYKGPVLAGGSEAPICRICVEGYGSSGVLSKKERQSASRPFDRDRDGFVLSEGACLMVLENRETALRRKAKIYGQVIGYCNTVDAVDQTKPDRGGKINAMTMALADAAIKSSNVDYLNAHGTSTILGDRIEAEAITHVFGAVPVSANKSATGHMLAASGALEAAFTVMGMSEGIIPPTLNFTEQDDDCRINVVSKKKKADIKIAVSNSFGFGGVNAVLVLSRAEK